MNQRLEHKNSRAVHLTIRSNLEKISKFGLIRNIGNINKTSTDIGKYFLFIIFFIFINKVMVIETRYMAHIIYNAFAHAILTSSTGFFRIFVYYNFRTHQHECKNRK